MVFFSGWIQPINTSASSAYRGLVEHDVSNLIDGKLGREGDYHDGECFLTDWSNANYHFVELELDGAYYITAVAILNRFGSTFGNDLSFAKIFLAVCDDNFF